MSFKLETILEKMISTNISTVQFQDEKKVYFINKDDRIMLTSLAPYSLVLGTRPMNMMLRGQYKMSQTFKNRFYVGK